MRKNGGPTLLVTAFTLLLIAMPTIATAADVPPEVDASNAKFVAACNSAVAVSGTQGWSKGYFGRDKKSRILTVDDAVSAKALSLRVNIDKIGNEIKGFNRQLANIQNQAIRQPASAAYLNKDVTCIESYLAFLQAVNAPAGEQAQQQAAQASASRIEERQQSRLAAQATQDSINAEAARKVRETNIIAAQAEADRRQRVEVAIASQREDVEAGKLEAEKLPSCNANGTLRALDAELRMHGVMPVSVDHSESDPSNPVGGTRLDPVRLCTARVISATGGTKISYVVKWVDDAHKRTQVLPVLTN